MLFVSSLSIRPVSQLRSSAVAVCGAISRLVQLILSPTRTRSRSGTNVKRAITTRCSTAAAGAATEAYGREKGKPQRMANWITGELFRLLYADGDGQDLRQIGRARGRPQQMAALVQMVDAREINANTGKKALESMYRSGDDARTVVEREGLAMVVERSVIDAAVQAAFDDNPEVLARYRNGEKKLFGFFMGQMMRATKGKADPQAARQRLQEMLDSF